jgi:hypothetical protein
MRNVYLSFADEAGNNLTLAVAANKMTVSLDGDEMDFNPRTLSILRRAIDEAECLMHELDNEEVSFEESDTDDLEDREAREFAKDDYYFGKGD